jgi:hypothetical protein
MSKTVCNSVEFVFVSEIANVNSGNIPVLKDGKQWKAVSVTEKPVYRSNVTQSEAGSVNEETVSVKASRNNLTGLLIEHCGFYTVLRMGTDSGIFYVGNPEYPCLLEYTSDRVFDSYSFKSVSPV